jgi:hypothetical protein
MDVFVSIMVFFGVYLLLNVLFLSPFLLSARISRWEEKNP